MEKMEKKLIEIKENNEVKLVYNTRFNFFNYKELVPIIEKIGNLKYKDKSGTYNFKSVNFKEIILIKYIIPLIFIYFAFNISTHYSSLLGFGSAGILYCGFKYLLTKSKTGTFALGFSLFIAYQVFAYNNFELTLLYSFGSILNYLMQYLLLFWILNFLMENLIKDRKREFFQKSIGIYFYENQKIYYTKSDILIQKIYKYLVIGLSVFMLVVGLSGLITTVLIDNLASKKISQRYVKDNFGYLPSKIKELKKSSKKYEISLNNLVHNKIGGVERYTRVQLAENSIVKKVTFLNNKEVLEDINNIKFIGFGSNKNIFKGFYKNDNYYFFFNNSIFKIIREKEKKL